MFKVRRQAWPAIAATVAVISAFGAPAVRACSICRCGDATFAALGAEAFSGARRSVALDYERFRKQSIHDEPLAAVRHTMALTEDRWTLSGLYGRGGRLTLLARLPLSARQLDVQEALTAKAAAHVHVTPGRYDAHALSDPEFSLSCRAWASRFEPQFGRRMALFAQAGVKLPWGRNSLELHGVRLAEHLQAGTGSTDVSAGLSALHLLDERSTLFLSVQLRVNGTNDAGYHYGSVVLANAAYERKLFPRLDSVVELNYRSARADRTAPATFDPDTGGQVLYVTPRVLTPLGAGWVARVAAQIPAVTRLGGRQTEHAVLNAGLTYLH